MKRRPFRIAALMCLLTSASFPLMVCRKNASEWKGTLERRGDVTIVKNPREPLRRSEALRLEKDLSIGKAEGEREYTFSSIAGVDADGEGNVYVLDDADALVKVFDGHGNFLRAIGRKGQGPGETERPEFVEITPQDEVFVYDYASFRVVFYSRDGVFLRQKPVGRPLLPVRLDSEGQLIGFEILAPPPLGGRLLKKYDRDYALLTVIAREEQGQRRVFDIGKPGVFCCAAPADALVWGDSGSYVLSVLNSKGVLVRTIEKDHRPVRITAADRERYEKDYTDALRAGLKLDFRDHFPAYKGIFADDEGRIIVKTYERVAGTPGSLYYDVFDSEGRYEARVSLPLDLKIGSVWKNRKLYTIESDPQGFQIVNRYAVSWVK